MYDPVNFEVASIVDSKSTISTITAMGEEININTSLWHRNQQQSDILLRYLAIPLRENEHSVWLGVDNLENISAYETFTFLTGKIIEPILLTTTALKDLLQQLNHQMVAGNNSAENLYLFEAVNEEDSDDSIDHDNPNEPITALLNQVFEQAQQKQVSDIHLEGNGEKYQIRFRIDGVLHIQKRISRTTGIRLISRLKILAKLDISETRLPQDGQFLFKTNWGDQLEFRIATMPTPTGEKVVLRMQKNSPIKGNFAQLGMSDEQVCHLNKVLTQPQGLILVTGPTGSGKSITLYTVLDKLNSEHKHILTAEDPIEIKLTGIIQTQVNPAINLTFANLLRSFLRLDPDIIMLGEIRDQESAEMAIRASQTGHLVLSTLHTNDATSAIVRLQQFGIQPHEIEKSLLLVIAQRLVRLTCPQCRGRGTECNCQDGYRGRVGIYQFLSWQNQQPHLDFPNLHASAELKVNSRLTDHKEIERVLGCKLD